MNLRIGKISRLVSPGWGSCYRCYTTWNFVKSHITSINHTSGCFPLCEKCWAELSVYERIPFYKQLYDSWKTRGCGASYPFEVMRIAVLKENSVKP